MFKFRYLLICMICGSYLSQLLCANEGEVILSDDFERTEEEPEKEQVGNGWGTNSRTRAKGVKQVDLVDGALSITRADVADHGVSVTHEVAFQDATIQLRFRLGPKDDLGINIADMKEKSVHAGHLCMAKMTLKQLEIVDLKTGRMNLEMRARRLEGKLTDDEKAAINQKSKYFPLDLSPNEWHTLKLSISGTKMSVWIDDELVGTFASDGIGHPTKSRLRLAVNKSAWVDDVQVIRMR